MKNPPRRSVKRLGFLLASEFTRASFASAATFGCVALIAMQRVCASEIDLNQVISDALVGSRPVGDVASRNNVCQSTGFWYKPCYKLATPNIRLFDPEVVYSNVKPAAIPVSVKQDSYVFINCSAEQRRKQQTLHVTYTQGNTIVTTDSVQQNSSINVTLPIKALSLGMTDSVQVNFSQQTTNNFTTSITEDDPFDEAIAPWTMLVVKIEKRVSNAYVNFSGKMTLDADVIGSPLPGWNGEVIQYGKLSSIVGNKRIDLRGQIWNATAENTTTSYKEVPMSSTAPQCSQGPALTSVLDSSKRKAISKLRKPLRGVLFFDLSQSPVIMGTGADGSSPPVETTVPFVDGMTITTADVAGSVDIHAMSLGPGLCGVTFSTAGASTQFLAPPGTYSPWTTLTANIGSVSLKLDEHVTCDTGVVAEVRYWK